MVQTAPLSTSEVAGRDAGRPCMGGGNVLERALTIAWSVTGTVPGVPTDVPARAVADRMTGLLVRPAVGAEVATWWLVWSFPAGIGATPVDCAAIWTDLPVLAGTVGDILAVLEVDDSAGFVSPVTAATWTIQAGNPDRVAAFFLQRILVGESGEGRWWRLRLRRADAADWPASIRPGIGELWIARRAQWLYPPQRPYDPDGTDADEDSITLLGGQQVGATRFRGRGVWDLSMRLRQDDVGAEARDVLRRWWADTDYGGPGLWWPRADQPARVHMVRPDGRALQMPEVGPAIQEAQIRLLEQPSYWAPQVRDGLFALPPPIGPGLGTILSPVLFADVWSGAGAPNTPGPLVPDTPGSPNAALTVGGSYSIAGTSGMATAAIGTSRLNRAILLSGIDAGFSFTGSPSAAGDVLWRVITRLPSPAAGNQFLLMDGESGANYAWIFLNSGGSLTGRIYDGTTNASIVIGASALSIAGFDPGDPILIDLVQIDGARNLYCQGLVGVPVPAATWAGASSGTTRLGSRMTNPADERWSAGIVGWGRTQDPSWWSPAQHAADAAALVGA